MSNSVPHLHPLPDIMKKCHSPDHPYCTHWVAEGESACAAGHAQAANPLRRELLHASAGKLTKKIDAHAPASLQLHFGGYDPRAAGGRQTLRLELRGTLPANVSIIEVQLRCELIAAGATRQRLLRTASGLWQPLLISFSSKNKEYGQYPIEISLSHEQEPMARRKWLCTSVIFVPRADASLTEIHSVFLAAQKNVRVIAEDGAIATLSGLGQSHGYAQGNMNIEINARDASVAKLDMLPPAGKYEIAMGTIAWDEELIEVAADESTAAPGLKQIPALTAAPDRGAAVKPVTGKPATKYASLATGHTSRHQPHRHIQLFALEEYVLGRMEEQAQADIQLSHNANNPAENARLTRRISARHAIIRRKGMGAEITDVSRYGTLLDGMTMEKDQAYALRAGMQIEFCASVRGIVKLQVMAILLHAIILSDLDVKTGSGLLYLLKPETRPMVSPPNMPDGLPLIFHFQDAFWSRDMLTAQENTLENRLDTDADLKLRPPVPLSNPYPGRINAR
ncbi:FHA domain-containing protein [Undibacterium sp. TC4M20W]|uniref:FHA domain-containing protein n=1 Tax=Undibacterium sp. TC4M20W TaxID=3413052 RepID=UPI003BF5E63E